MNTKRVVLAGVIALATVATVTHLTASDDRHHDRRNRLRATLLGSHEVPVVASAATGKFKAEIKNEQSIEYELTYSGLQGVVAQAHIHIAQKNVNGGIVLWLCQGTARAPAQVAALTPECPQEGTVSGTLTSANVTAVATQQFGANQLDDVIAAIRAGFAYANVHTAPSPGGEIRGQVSADDDDHGHKGK